MMMQPTLTATQKAQLTEFLQQLPQAMDLAQLEGYLFALICAPAPSEPSEWINTALGEQVAQADDSVLFALMALHNDLSDAIFSHGFRFAQHYQLQPHWQDNFLPSSQLAKWSSGFLIGIESYYHTLQAAKALPKSSKAALQQAVYSLGFFANEENLQLQRQETGQPAAQLCETFYQLIGDFSLGFAELIECVAMQSGLYNDEGWD